jgi:glycosyltransferase involved in cell wall biosynthesis
MEPAPAITVLIPAHRSAEFVGRTLESVSAQTRGDFTAIVSVDSQGDGTFEACREHAARDARFEVIQQPRRLGWVENSNFLLGQVRSPYAVFLFHDDLLAPTYLERLAAALEADPLAAVAFSDMHFTHRDGRTELRRYDLLEGVERAVDRGLRVLSVQGQWWVPVRGLVRTTAIRKAGSLKRHDSGEFAADLPWIFHLALTGRFVRVPETLYFKFLLPGSLSTSWEYSLRQRFDSLVACMWEIWLSDLPAADKLALAEPLLVMLKKVLPMAQQVEMVPATKSGEDR